MIRLFTKTRRRKTRDGFSPSPLIRELDAAGYVRVTDAVTADQPSEITQAQFQGLVSGGGKNLLIADGGTGVTSGWLFASSNPERFALELSVATGGAAASLTLDASDDGVVSAAQIATAALDVTAQQLITPPLGIPYKYLRWTIVSAGTGNVRIARGI